MSSRKVREKLREKRIAHDRKIEEYRRAQDAKKAIKEEPKEEPAEEEEETSKKAPAKKRGRTKKKGDE